MLTISVSDIWRTNMANIIILIGNFVLKSFYDLYGWTYHHVSGR